MILLKQLFLCSVIFLFFCSEKSDRGNPVTPNTQFTPDVNDVTKPELLHISGDWFFGTEEIGYQYLNINDTGNYFVSTARDLSNLFSADLFDYIQFGRWYLSADTVTAVPKSCYTTGWEPVNCTELRSGKLTQVADTMWIRWFDGDVNIYIRLRIKDE